MKRLFALLMLLTGINIQGFAQTGTDPHGLFELRDNPYHRKLIINLEKKNKVIVEVYSLEDLVYLQHIDSILSVFITDMNRLKDSIPRPAYARTIEYTVDTDDFKRISIGKSGGTKSNFVINRGELGILKLVQDTIIINGTVPGLFHKGPFRQEREPHYYRVSFYLNDLNELKIYRTTISEKFISLAHNVKGKWKLGQDGYMHLVADPSVSAVTKAGYTGRPGFIAVRPSIDIQNYKNLFDPSLSSGIAFVKDKNLVHREYIIGVETHCMFNKNTAGRIDTYFNTFIVLSYGQANINPYTKKNNSLHPFISLGYLAKRKGDFFNKHTFKLGLGQFYLFSNYTKIEPTLYFHDFFRAFTPSLRITQQF